MIGSFRHKAERRPTHPGLLLREETLPAARLTPKALAARLCVSQRKINELLREHRSANPDLAHRLARVFNTTPEFWLRLQEAVDVWDARQANRRKYEPIEAVD